MSIESRLPQNEINIKDLNLETPEVGTFLSFDPEKEITAAEWEQMKSTFKDVKRVSLNASSRPDFGKLMQLLAEMKQLFPERDIELELDDEFWEETKSMLEALTRENDWLHLAYQAALMKILYPQKSKEIKMKSSFGAIKATKNHIEETEIGQQCLLFYSMKMLYPDRQEDFGMDEFFKKRLENHIYDSFKKQDWYTYANLAAYYKFLFPEDKRNLNLDKDVWKDLRKLLHSHPMGIQRDFGFPKLAKNMKMLAAEEIKVTDQGLEFINPPLAELEGQAVTLPKIKKF